MTNRFQKQIIILALLIGINHSAKFENSLCSDHIDQFPEYSCVQENQFGKGASGIAFTIKREDKVYILKVQKLIPKKEKALNDLQFLNQLKPSPYVIELIDHKEVGDFLYEILEFGSKGDFENYIKNNADKFKDKGTVLKFFSQIVEAVTYVHDKKVTHNDLKPENIVVMDDETLKLIDFDVALLINSLARGRGTLEFMDPVIINNWGKQMVVYNEKRDIYSLGVILFFMSQGRYPFNAGDSIEEWKAVHSKPFYTFNKGTPIIIAKIASMCLIANGYDRPALKTIRQMVKEAISETDTSVLQSDIVIKNTDKEPFKFKDGKLQDQGTEVANQESNIDSYSSFYSRIRFLVIGFLVVLVIAPCIVWYLFFSSSNKPELVGIQNRNSRNFKTTQVMVRDLEAGLKLN